MKESKIIIVLLMLGVAITLNACSSNQRAAKSSFEQSQTVASQQRTKKQVRLSVNDLANSVTAYPQTNDDGTIYSYVLVPDEAAMIKINKALPKKSRIMRLDFAQALIDGDKSKESDLSKPREVDLAQVAKSLNFVLNSDLTNPEADLKKYVFIGKGIKTFIPVKTENKTKGLREVAE